MGKKETFGRLRQLEHHIDSPIRMYVNDEPDDYPPHWHSSIEVILPRVNTYSVEVSDHTYLLQPGEVLVIPAGAVHEIFAPEHGERLIFEVDRSHFCTLSGISAVEHAFYPCVYLTEETQPELLEEVRDCLLSAAKEYFYHDYFTESGALLQLQTAFVKIGRSLINQKNRDKDTTKRKETLTIYLDCCAYITNRCTEKLTLDEVADYAGYSKYHFERFFKEHAGKTFYEFLTQQRMIVCEHLLSDFTISVTEVALRTGFDSIATFNRRFKQYEGMTPSDFRKIHEYRGKK